MSRKGHLNFKISIKNFNLKIDTNSKDSKIKDGADERT